MSIRVDEAIGVHQRALDLRLQRSEILAANLANEDTPNFQARDIDFAGEMQRSNADFNVGDVFASADGGKSEGVPQLMYRTPLQASLDGNTVDLSAEQTAFSKNAMDYQTSLTFLDMNFRGLKQAIEGR